MLRNEYERLACEMVEAQLRPRGIVDSRVLEAMVNVPRHRFVEGSGKAKAARRAYEDHPMAIGRGQTISQPFVVASMTQALDVSPGCKVLEVGTGCGYQTAVLLEMGAEVWSIERHDDLRRPAEALLGRLYVEAGHGDVIRERLHLVTGDGTLGWPAGQPFDRIIVTAGAPALPKAYRDQLTPHDGCIVIPIGSRESQTLTRLVSTSQGLCEEKMYDCRFVPLTGADGWRDDSSD